jgi:hypothetical protein
LDETGGGVGFNCSRKGVHAFRFGLGARMATLVADCPRCGSKSITFDIKDALVYGSEYDWQMLLEMPCICRACHRFTVFFTKQEQYEHRDLFRDPKFLLKGDVNGNDYVRVEGFVSTKDRAAVSPPEHLPPEIAAAFAEGSRCLSVSCPNAAGAMFRTCIDLATRSRLPEGESEGLTSKVRRDLGLRLPWLFAQNILPKDLEALSRCIREDGNDGAHAASLTQEDAEDLIEFTQALLERLYTEPARLKIAEARRDARRQPKA